MTTDQIIIAVAGLALIVYTVWYFWILTPRGTRATVTSGDHQEATILVHCGYTPDVVIVQLGIPLRLNFRREETASCSEMVLFPAFDKRVQLPVGKTVPIEFVPKRAGDFDFTCQKQGGCRGTLVVQ